MKKIISLALLFTTLVTTLAGAAVAAAQDEKYTTYTIVRGDTLWGLSKRFLNDPYYWPNLWAANQSEIGNPHFIYPGQRVRVYANRIEIEPAVPPTAAAPHPTTPVAPQLKEEGAPAGYAVSGSEGFIMENNLQPLGVIVSTQQNRVVVGEGDIVYTDLGRVNGANVGDRFSIFKTMGPVSHPVSNVILGERVIPLGELQLAEMEEKTSKAIITKSFQEISAGAFILPYHDRRVTIPLKAADRDLTGYIVDTQTGNMALSVGDLVYLDLGSAQGVQAGNLLYIVRDVTPDQRYALAKIEKLPVDVIGALVVVQTGVNTSTAAIVKSVETVYRGDRVEMKKSR